MNNRGIPVEDSNGIPMTESKKDNQKDFKRKAAINLDSVVDVVEDFKTSQKSSHKVESASQPKNAQKYDLKSTLKEDFQLDSMDILEPESKDESKRSSKMESRFESLNSSESESFNNSTGSITEGAAEQNVEASKSLRSSLTPEAQLLLSKILLDRSLVPGSGEVSTHDSGEKKPKKPVKKVAVRIKGTDKVISPKAGDILRRVALDTSAQHLVTEAIEDPTETMQNVDAVGVAEADITNESQKQERLIEEAVDTVENHEESEEISVCEQARAEEASVESKLVKVVQEQLNLNESADEVAGLNIEKDVVEQAEGVSDESDSALVEFVNGGFVEDAQEPIFKDNKSAGQSEISEQTEVIQEHKAAETSSETREKKPVCSSDAITPEENGCERVDTSREDTLDTSSQRDFTSLKIGDIEECEPEQDECNTEGYAVNSLHEEVSEGDPIENDALLSQQEVAMTSKVEDQEITVRGNVVYSPIGEDEIVESARKALEGKKTYEVTSVTSVWDNETLVDNSKQSDSAVPEYRPKLQFNSVEVVGDSDVLPEDSEGKLNDATSIVEDSTKGLTRIKKKPVVVSNTDSSEEISLVPSFNQANTDNLDWMDNPKHVYLVFGSVLAVTVGLIVALVVKYYKPVTLENSQQPSDSQVSIGMLNTDSFKELATNQVITNGIRDYNSALGINSDTVGWLTVIGTTIDTALLQNEDNEYYSRRNILGEDDWNGSCWVDSSCKLDKNVLPTVTIVYGHSMSEDPNGELFSQLKKFNSSSFCADHRYILTDFFGVDYTWEIFASGKVPVELDYTNAEPTEEEYEALLTDLKDASAMDYQTSVSTTDKILILSTCTYDDQGVHGSTYKNYRYVVCAKLSH